MGAWILKFIFILQHRKSGKKFVLTNQHTVEELKNAELAMLCTTSTFSVFPVISSPHGKSKPLPRFMQKRRPI